MSTPSINIFRAQVGWVPGRTDEFKGQHKYPSSSLPECPKPLSLKPSYTQLQSRMGDNLAPISLGISSQGTYGICANRWACFPCELFRRRGRVKHRKSQSTASIQETIYIAHLQWHTLCWVKSSWRKRIALSRL